MARYKNFNKKIDKMPGVSASAGPPNFWIDFGNYVINKTMTGTYTRGIPQGRLTQLAGPSGAGKSFIAGNIVRAAQQQGYGILVIDSENALDDEYMMKIGVDVDHDDYLYAGLNTMKDCITVVQAFLKEFREDQAKGTHVPFLIVIDSLDMLQTDSEVNNYNKGEVKGDQGQHVKQLKSMLTPFMHDIKKLDVAMLCTKQVYKEQDAIAAMSNPWVITESLKFAFSQIMLITKLQLKDKDTKKFEGIKLKASGAKTRFTKPFQQCMIEVPYETGMNKYSGLLEACVSMGIIEQKGAWYTIEENKFQRKNAAQYEPRMLELLLEKEDEILNVDIDAEEDHDDALTHTEIVRKRQLREKAESQMGEKTD